ncbi:MAG: RNA 2',3'-cyclic phosphodiesterase [Vicinamibacterales bacterium]
MRLFVAADLSDETRAQVRSVRDQLEPLLRGRRAARVTWVRGQAAHVTLRFIGERSDQDAAAIASALMTGFAVASCDARWDRLGTFPAGRRPRVVWIGATAGADALANLARLVAARLEPVIGPGETPPFNAHVTIGRVRDPGKIAWPEALTRVTLEPTITYVDHVTLYRSHLSPKGSTYTELCRAPLISRT